jgi:glycosyltransferase involved in cell wall biosynthesis
MSAILAFEKIKSEYSHVNLTIISSNVPQEIFSKYQNIICFKKHVSPKELHKEYCSSDIFLLPTHVDTFGFVFLEAMSYGLPCICVNTFATPEIITNTKTGIVVNSSISLYDEKFRYKFNIVSKEDRLKFENICKTPSSKDIVHLENAIISLIKNPKLLANMSHNCIQEIKNGKFSSNFRIQEISQLLANIN